VIPLSSPPSSGFAYRVRFPFRAVQESRFGLRPVSRPSFPITARAKHVVFGYLLSSLVPGMNESRPLKFRIPVLTFERYHPHPPKLPPTLHLVAPIKVFCGVFGEKVRRTPFFVSPTSPARCLFSSLTFLFFTHVCSGFFWFNSVGFLRV